MYLCISIYPVYIHYMSWHNIYMCIHNTCIRMYMLNCIVNIYLQALCKNVRVRPCVKMLLANHCFCASSAITTRGREPSTITTRGCEPSSTAEGIIYDSSAITTRGCEPSSTAEGIIYDSSAITTRGCEPSSTAEGIIYDSSAITSRGCELSSTAEGIIYDSSAITSRGREPSSTAEGIIYSSDWADVATTSGPLIQETGHPLLVSTRGQAPQSTAQIKMYPLRYTEHSKEEVIKREENKQELELPAIEYGPSFKYKDDFSFNGIHNDIIVKCTFVCTILNQ